MLIKQNVTNIKSSQVKSSPFPVLHFTNVAEKRAHKTSTGNNSSSNRNADKQTDEQMEKREEERAGGRIRIRIYTHTNDRGIE